MPVATAATATHETSPSPHAAKETTSASKSQIASKLAANPLVPAEIAPSTSPCPEYRAISSTPPKYKSMKSQSYLMIDKLYTRYAPLRYIRSSHLTMQDLYMRYASLNTIKLLILTRSTSSTRSIYLISRILSIIMLRILSQAFILDLARLSLNASPHISGNLL